MQLRLKFGEIVAAGSVPGSLEIVEVSGVMTVRLR